MKFFLTAKHLQIFLILLFGLFNSNFTYIDKPTITAIVRIIGLLVSFSWILFTGHGLYNYLPNKVKLSYHLFIINWFVVVAGFATVEILSDGEGMVFNGIAAIPTFYIGYAFLHILTFPGRIIKSIELGRKASFDEYISNFFLLIFWPFGIWNLQPRINRIVNQ